MIKSKMWELYLAYFSFGFSLSFSAIAVQFTMFDFFHMTPAEMSVAYAFIAFPWSIKPLYGYISDSYAVFDWGNRRIYISFFSLCAATLFVYMGSAMCTKFLFVSGLTLISTATAFADVCSDGIVVSIAKKERIKGSIQSRVWIARAFGALIGALFGGEAYKRWGAVPVFHVSSIIPLLLAFWIWRNKDEELKPNATPVLKNLIRNLREQKNLALTLFFVSLVPDYGQFYSYFLKTELGFSEIDFTWLTVAASSTFLTATIFFHKCLLTESKSRVILVGIAGATLFRLTQLLVVTKVLPLFSLVLLDTVAESFFDQLVLFPLIVLSAKTANEGNEATFYALLMSISNFSNVAGDYFGAFVGYLFNIDEHNYKYLPYFMAISILWGAIVPVVTILRMEKKEKYSVIEPSELPKTS